MKLMVKKLFLYLIFITSFVCLLNSQIALCENGNGDSVNEVKESKIADDGTIRSEATTTPQPTASPLTTTTTPRDTVVQQANDTHTESQLNETVHQQQTSTEEHKMQSFEEWKHMRLKEQPQAAEQHTASNGALTTQTSSASVNPSSNTAQQHQQRIVHKKNFASVDCGAKILAANVEATGASHILTESKDEYMLNSCSNKIWFIIELCEPIQITDIEIANYELFSNIPKQLRVYASERYPQKNWTKALFVGTFDAQPLRNLQLFHVDNAGKSTSDAMGSQQASSGGGASTSGATTTGGESGGVTEKPEDLQQKPSLYVKYVRFEMLSHYGNEHYCPISLVRIYGVTLVDDDVDGSHDDQIQSAGSGEATTTSDNTESSASRTAETGNGSGGGGGDVQNNNTHVDDKSGIIDIAYQAINNIIAGSADSKTTGDARPDESAGQDQQAQGTTVSPVQQSTASSDSTGTSSTPDNSQTVTTSSQQSSTQQQSTDKQRDVTQSSSSSSTPAVTVSSVPVSSSQHGSSQATETTTSTVVTPVEPQPVEHEKEKKLKFYSKFLDNLISFFIRISHKDDTAVVTLSPLLTTTTTQTTMDNQQQQQQQRQQQQQLLVSQLQLQQANTNENSESDSKIIGMIYKTLLCSYSNVNQMCCQCLINTSQDDNNLYCTYYFIILNTCKNVFTQFAYKYEKSIKQFIDLNLISNTTATTGSSNKTSNYTNYTAVNINNISYFILNDLLFTFDDSKQQHHQQPSKITSAIVTPTTTATSTPPPPPPPLKPTTEPQVVQNKPQQQQNVQIKPIVTNTNTKDVLFMRLNNRIRALELNMSLSGQYLEQLSQHYRKQIDEMQRIFNKTTMSLQDTTNLIDDHNAKQQSQMKAIEDRLDKFDYQTSLFLNYINSNNLTLSSSSSGGGGSGAGSSSSKPSRQRVTQASTSAVNVLSTPGTMSCLKSGQVVEANYVFFVNNEIFLVLILLLILNVCIFVTLVVYVRIRLRMYYAVIHRNEKRYSEAELRCLINKCLNERVVMVNGGGGGGGQFGKHEYEEIGQCGTNGTYTAVIAVAAVAAAASSTSLTQINGNT